MARIDAGAVSSLAVASGLSEVTASVLLTRGIDSAEAVRRFLEPSLERDWVRTLLQGDFRLPDAAQPFLEDARCRPDFFYAEAGTAIFIDGPVHERDDKAREDAAAQERLLELGYGFVRFRAGEDWLATIREHAEVFGKGRLS